LRLRFLGTGTSFGIPVVGCACEVCTSVDPRDRRTRHAALLTSADGERSLLVDTPPELRLQLLDAGVRRIDAVWFTHAHADHTHGIDDLRVFSARARRSLPAWADAETAAFLHRTFAYIFDASYRPPEGTTKPEITLNVFDGAGAVSAAGFSLLPVPATHGDMTAWGFRVGPLGYVTDAKKLTPASLEKLRGARVLVLNALWFGDPHPTHLNVEEAVELSRSLDAQQTYLTHITHRVSHAVLEKRLPDGVHAAWDGLMVNIEET
jgi:phosphoribosyl 1,2-cyclic phosphate phosphodiesterase